MIKETLTHEHTSTLLRIDHTAIQSEEKKEILKTGMRIYLSGIIGIAGMEGPLNEMELEKKAVEMLESSIPYAPEPTMDQQICLIYNYDVSHGPDFAGDMEDLLATMRSNFSSFAFFNEIELIDHCFQLQNNAGLFLQYQDHFLRLNLTFKHKTSDQEVDSFLKCIGRKFDKDLFLKLCEDQLSAYQNPIELETQKKHPLIFSTKCRDIFVHLIDELNGHNIAKGKSQLKEKMGKKIFHDDFTFYQSHNTESLIKPYFDAEGTVHLENDFRVPLIENGIMLKGYTDKKTALEYDLPLTGSAVSEHHEVPFLSLDDYELKGNKLLADLLDGQKGILVVKITNSAFDQNGNFQASVPLAYLTDGEKLMGKMPPFKIVSNIKNMFNDDFIGVSKDPLFPLNHDQGILMNFELEPW